MNTLLETKYQNRLTLTRRVKRKDSKINERNLANMPECNLILSDLYYFLHFYWATYEPIVSLKQKGSSLSRQYINISGQSPLVGVIKIPLVERNHPQDTTILVSSTIDIRGQTAHLCGSQAQLNHGSGHRELRLGSSVDDHKSNWGPSATDN